MAVVAPLVLMLLLGMVDLGIGVYAYNTVAESARAGARYAAVHGSRSSSPTGPSSNDAKVASVVKSYAPALSSSELTIKSDWTDGSNDPESKVTVTVEYNYKPTVTWFIGFKTLKLSGTSTMVITH